MLAAMLASRTARRPQVASSPVPCAAQLALCALLICGGACLPEATLRAGAATPDQGRPQMPSDLDAARDGADRRDSDSPDAPGPDQGGLTDLASPDADRSDADASDAAPDAAPDADAPDAGESDADMATPCVRPTLQAQIDRVQPMTGIAVWASSWAQHPIKTQPGNLQLEYAYMTPGQLSTGPGQYDWSALDALLAQVAQRGHQLILRFHYVWPGRQTGVPAWLKARPDYQETSGLSEGALTWFPDWSSQALMSFHLDFFDAFAARYDQDPRVAFLQVGFGLWAEYHIYEGPRMIGAQFPSHAFQRDFVQRLDQRLRALTWSVSIDAGSSYYAPFAQDAALRALPFGLFDDSFMHADHDAYNAMMWQRFEHATRYARAPHGGELSYYSEQDQRHALDVGGLHGRTFEALAARYQITYMIGDGQPEHQPLARIKQASMALGYRLRLTRFERCQERTTIEVLNEGIAPLYQDAWVALEQTRAPQTLKGLLPGQRLTVTLRTSASPGAKPTIEGARLVPGQRINYAAQLP